MDNKIKNISVEAEIKEQYSKVYCQSDWMKFKIMADFYFERSSKLMKKDVQINDELKLMVRNIQKRLFIGLGTEFLLKALFLKKNYCINRAKSTSINKPIEFDTLNKTILDSTRTFTLNTLIENISEIFTCTKEIERGLKIAKVFRNKEGHVITLYHKADSSNYRDIENCITTIYQQGFNEILDFKISFLKDEEGKFSINNGIAPQSVLVIE